MKRIVKNLRNKFCATTFKQGGEKRRIGLELKFPLVDAQGNAATCEDVQALWAFLHKGGWTPVIDKLTGGVVGAKRPGPQNDTVASCETGFCKTEFSLAHVADLWQLDKAVQELRRELDMFSAHRGVLFLGYGVQPKTPPSAQLVIKKERTAFWEKVFGSNRLIPADAGSDVHLFTINASSQVHLDVHKEEAISAVNVLNGFAGAQIGLTAHSNIWRGAPDLTYKCVCEKFWDWWLPNDNRVGIPNRPFTDLDDYVKTLSDFRPVYVKREGTPIVLTRYSSFTDYYKTGEEAEGEDFAGQEVGLSPSFEDFALQQTFCWHTARISRYGTVENRVNDQQPPNELLCVAALTLGLTEALPEAMEELSAWDWGILQQARLAACKRGLDEADGAVDVHLLATRMLSIAERGLRKRALSEERFLETLKRRLKRRECPADSARRAFETGGIGTLVETRRLCQPGMVTR